MCAFFASQIFDHPRLKDVTYYMRLDTDSYIFKPLCYDPIDLFHQHNRSYAYNARTSDPDWVTVGLWELVDEYARSHEAVESSLEKNGWQWAANRDREQMRKHDFPTYYNNFEIVKLDAFRRPDIRAWLDEIMRIPERIYKYRWGELTLLSLEEEQTNRTPQAMLPSVMQRSVCSLISTKTWRIIVVWTIGITVFTGLRAHVHHK